MTQTSFQATVDTFLASKRIAVAGVSRKGNLPANYIYKKLREAGYEVFALNPAVDTIEGDACYPSLSSIPGGVEALMIATPPAAAIDLVKQCIALGIPQVWMHRSVDGGSYHETAAELAREHGITVIPAGCPMMFVGPVDFAHRCMKFVFKLTGSLPKKIPAGETAASGLLEAGG